MPPIGDGRKRIDTDITLGRKYVLPLDIVRGIRDTWLNICSLLLSCVLCSETCLAVERIDVRNGMHAPLFSHKKTVLISLEHVGTECNNGKNIGSEAGRTSVQSLYELRGSFLILG